jgi:predicted RNase H-like HicB family nuclease
MLDAMARDFNVVIERDSEGFYVASVPSLRGCHTQARSLDELMERIREAIELCLAAFHRQGARRYPWESRI